MATSSYEIKIVIDGTSVSSISLANQAVTIVKSVSPEVMTGAARGPMPGYLPVAWLQFQPFETNTVTWTETYEIYASKTPLVTGNQIQQLSVTQASPGPTYTFQKNSFITDGTSNAANYKLNNQGSDTFCFGLSQQAVVNSTTSEFAPLNAVPVLNNQQATFSPTETVDIFRATYFGNGVVVSEVPAQALTVALSSGTVTAIGFSDTQNTFYLK